MVMNEVGFQPDDTQAAKAENARIILQRSAKHKTLEERAAIYNGKLNLDGEVDWRGDPAGNEIG